MFRSFLPLPPPNVPTQLSLELSQNASFKHVLSLKPAKSPESLDALSPKTSVIALLVAYISLIGLLFLLCFSEKSQFVNEGVWQVQ